MGEPTEVLVPPLLPATRVRGWGRGARLAAWALLLVALGGSLLPQAEVEAPPPDPDAPAEGVDTHLYAQVVHRVRAGEAYHPVLREELVAGGFPLRPVFNWRQPLGMRLVAAFASDEAAASAYRLAALIGALLVGGAAFRRHGLVVGALSGFAAVLCVAPFGSAAGVLFTERWSTLALLYAGAAYVAGLRPVGALALVLALAFRELAAPFCLLGVIDAVRGRHRAELGAWLGAGVLWAVSYAGHVAAVEEVLAATGVGPREPRSWLALGGLPFLRSALVWFAPVTLVPSLAWVWAALAALGALAWPGREAWALRVGLVACWAALLVVGLPFNHYWGAMVAAPGALTLPWALPALRDLVAAERQSSVRTAQSSG